MIIRRAILLMLIALPVAAASSTGTVNQQDGPAVGGYDVVAYFTDARAVPGRGDLTAEHDGAIYRFSSQANRSAFIESPTRYLPQFGGYCAFGLARGYKAVIDPQAFTIVDGKLYLNYSQTIQSKWRGQQATDISLANTNWPKVINSPDVTK
jgi:YHS domain-containing protein